MLDRDADFAVAVYTLQGAIENLSDLRRCHDGWKLRYDLSDLVACVEQLNELIFSLCDGTREAAE